MNQADTAWMLISTALVLLMTPALAFFYGGLVRSKNALNTMMMSFISLGFVGVLWALVGYSLALTAGNNWLGDLSLAFLNGVGLEATGRSRAAHDSPHALHGVPGHVLHHHGRADLRRHRRADAVLGLRGVHLAVVGGRLRAARALGVGRRLAGRHGRLGLRRRNGRPRERRHRGARRGARRRQAAGLSVVVAPSAQRSADAARRRPALVRLVRVQRGQRAGREPDCRPGVRDDDAGARRQRWWCGRSST